MSQQPPIERKWDAPKPPPKLQPAWIRWMDSHRWVVILLIFLVVPLAALLVSLVPSSSGGGADAAEGDRYGAFTVCQDQVSAQLRSPSTADFASIVESNVNGSRGIWHVSSYVDAQNGFGAMIRTSWTCTAIHQSGDRYKVTVSLS